MKAILAFFGSSIGKKLVMAVTGVALVGFVMGHMSGNLLVYKGPEALNAYAKGLHTFPALLWAARLGLLAAVGLHIWASTTLTLVNQAARPVGYRKVTPDASSYASRTMKFSGPLLGLFIVYHLLHLTLGSAHPSFRPGDVYHNFIAGFQVPVVSFFYIAAMLALGFHLHHGIWSFFQTLGVNHPRYDGLRKVLATLITVVVVGGNLSFPIAVLTGVLQQAPPSATSARAGDLASVPGAGEGH
jgi:succinate dehydrogenase / fumarate reductase cytochrome b subunit